MAERFGRIICDKKLLQGADTIQNKLSSYLFV